MKPLGLSSNGLARSLDVTPARINEIIRERRGISANTALRLARFFGTDVQSWMNLQTHYDIQCAEDIAGRAIRKIAPRRDEALVA
jgi:antitoxin HigA-1